MSDWVSERIAFWYKINPVGVLNEYCQKKKLIDEPKYFVKQIGSLPVSEIGQRQEFAVKCTVQSKVHTVLPVVYSDVGFGGSKKEAKRYAASQILHMMSLHDRDLEQIVGGGLNKS